MQDSAQSLTSRWQKHKAVWEFRFPWLQARVCNGEVQGLGCSVCGAHFATSKTAAGADNVWILCQVKGSSVQPCAFQKHQDSKAHQEACGHVDLGITAPTCQQFSEALEAVWRGDNETASMGRFKVRNLVWALAEAHRVDMRKALADASCVSIAQDVRKGVLCVSFSACNNGLQTTHGFFSHCDLNKSALDSKAIFEGTLGAIMKFCTEGLGCPGAREYQPRMHHEIVEHLKSTVECFSADGAADEQRAGKLMRGFFKNLWIHQHDKAHACKRFLSRTWIADGYLKRIGELLCLSKDSIAQLVHWSPLFRQRFKTAVAEMTQNANSRIRDLAAAKHRFTSQSLPLRRAVLYFLPLLRVAQSIYDERGSGSSEGSAAKAFLSALDSEAALQLSMMADAGDECIIINRVFDKSCIEKENISQELQTFVQRCSWLFEHGGAETTGCCAFMLQLLQTPRTIIVDGQVRTISAPTDEIKNRCFARMKNWLDLARAVIRSDFPEFESLQLFSVFRLQDSTLPQTSALNKLADFLNVNPAQFVQEFQHIWPIADWHFRNGAKSQESAWQQAFNKKGSFKSHPALHAALLRHLSWQTSTSGIERLFGKAYCSTSICRGDVSETRVDDELQSLICISRASYSTLS